MSNKQMIIQDRIKYATQANFMVATDVFGTAVGADTMRRIIKMWITNNGGTVTVDIRKKDSASSYSTKFEDFGMSATSGTVRELPSTDWDPEKPAFMTLRQSGNLGLTPTGGTISVTVAYYDESI